MSMMLGEERHFFAVSLIRNVDALWDSSATWTLSAANSATGWPSFSFAEQSLVYDGPLPKRCPCHSVHKTFKGLTQHNGIVGLFLLGTGTAVDCRVHRSEVPWGWRLFCTSGTDSRRALTKSSHWLRHLLAGAHFIVPGLLVISPGYSWSMLRISPDNSYWSMLRLVLWTSTYAVLQLFLWTRWLLLSISVSPTVSAPTPPAVAFPPASSSSSRVLSLKARSRTPRRSKTPLVLLEPRGHGDGVRG